MLDMLALNTLNSHETMTLLIVALCGATGVLIAVPAVMASSLKAIAVGRMEVGLKREMVERGMSAESIALVVNTHGGPGGAAVNLPCASEVVVEWVGDWYPALVLQAAEGRYYIHFIGHDMNENEWVGADRIRFPAGSPLPAALAQAGFRGNGVAAKEPAEAEL